MKKSASLSIIAAGGALGAVGMSRVPMTMLEWAIASTGFSELLPALAPPLGDTARLSLCGAAGLLAMACVAALLPSPSSSRHEKKMTMASVFSRIAHFARGGAAASAENPMRLRRADAHPDAPPRAPLSVVRDLGERLESSAPVALRMPGVAPFEPPVPAAMPPFAPPPGEVLDEVEPDIVTVKQAEAAVIEATSAIESVPVPEAVTQAMFAPAPLPVPVSEPLAMVMDEDDDSLASLSISQLIDRLERGLRNLEVAEASRGDDMKVEPAQVAQAKISSSPERPLFAEPAMVAGTDVHERQVEGTLQSALAALRGMNAQAV